MIITNEKLKQLIQLIRKSIVSLIPAAQVEIREWEQQCNAHKASCDEYLKWVDELPNLWEGYRNEHLEKLDGSKTDSELWKQFCEEYVSASRLMFQTSDRTMKVLLYSRKKILSIDDFRKDTDCLERPDLRHPNECYTRDALCRINRLNEYIKELDPYLDHCIDEFYLSDLLVKRIKIDVTFDLDFLVDSK